MKKISTTIAMLMISVLAFCQTNYYVNDNSTAGDVFTTAVGSNANVGSVAAPFATLSYAITQAAANDFIYVDAGTYAEQVIIDKGITIRGAGQNLTSFITPSTALVPAPGPFTEKGLFETIQGIGDVHISDLSITSNNSDPSQNIIIQSGGSVKNCKLINGGQGIFFRIESGARNALVENNEIQPNGIGVNCQGSGLTAIISNNTISKVGGYYAGVFAGLDFGPLPQLTIQNNNIQNYFGDGMLVSSYNGNYIYNSIFGSGSFAINRFLNRGNTPNATCNWFGTKEAEQVKPKISGAVNYIPWLVSGVDTDPVALGFQPAAGTCTGRQNKFYVNDNSQTGDVFTTVVGNNANNGFSSAPFATIKYAVSLAQSGDTIYVDAGTYPQDSTSFTINKSVVILGSNFNISPNNITNKFIGNTDRVAESIISNTTFFIGASNIGLKGFTLSPGSRNGVALSNAAAGNLSFIRNKVVLTSSIAILLTGTTVPNAAALSSSDYFITDNRFEKTGNASPQAINLRFIKNVEVINNAFVRVGTSTRTLTAVVAGQSGGVVDNLTMQNNVSEGTNNNLFTFSLAKATIAGNKFKNYNNGLFIQTVIPGSTDINILNNTFETDTTTANHIVARTFDAATADSNKITILGNTLSINAVSSMTTMPIAITTYFPLTSINPVLKISGNVINFGGNFSKIKVSQIGGINLNGKNKNTIVDNNNVYFNGTEPDTSFSAFKASGIYVTHDGPNTLPPGSSISIQNNAIKGFKNSISFYDFTASATDSYVGYGNLPAGVSVAISKNSFTNDSISINNGTDSQPVNASCNWYGSSIAQNVLPKITAQTVIYSPWLTNGTDADIATGFQPLPNTCNGGQTKFYVNDNNLSGDVFTIAIGNNANPGTSTAPLATLQYAVLTAKSGDTVYIDAGTYALATNLTLNKSITILGGNYLVSPNNAADKTQYNSGRNTESIITGSTILIGADNINMNGLRFSTDTTAVSLFADYSHIKFDKNIFDVARSGASLNLQGVSSTPIVAFDFSITDCRFERKDLLNGSSVNLGLVKSLWIDNNTFIETPTTGNPNRGIALRTVPGQNVEGAAFSNNYVKKLNTGVLSFIVQDFGISNNIFDSCTTGYNQIPNGAISNNIFIRTNTFTNTRIGRSILVRGGSGGGINNLNILDNTINQEVDGINGIVGMIQLDFALANTYGDVSVLANRINISGNYLNTSPRTNPGVILIGKHSNTKVWYNDLNFTATNAYYNGLGVLPNIPTGIFISTDGGTGSGNIPANAVININNNKINGFKNSIGIYDPAATGLNSFVGYGNLTAGATVNINNNSFTGDSISVNNGTIGQSVNATCNWYGSSAAQNLITKVTSLTVNYSPWLTNGTDNEAGAGFEPVANTCNGVSVNADIILITNVTCNGAANGAIDVFMEDGVAPFTFAWSKDEVTGFSVSEDLNNLTPGFYKLIVTDVNGSVDSVFTTITEPDILTSTTEGINNVCFGASTGEATVFPVGGTAPYTYVWSNGQTTETISNLVAGIYTVTVTDANGCTKQSSYEVTQPTLVTASIANNSTACSNIATVTAGGGTPGYTYLWSNGATTAIISSVPVGTYSITVTDVNGCMATASITLSVGEAFNPSASITNVSCFGANNGVITVTNANGTAPFSFSIDGVNFVPGTFPYNFSNLAAGTYTIAVKDAKGCTGFVTKTITQPPLLTITNSVQPTCFGSNTGSINVTASGGSGAYSYSWTGNNYTSSQRNISNLAAGNYSLTVTDNNGCTVQLPVVVSSFNEIIVTSTVTNIACKGQVNGAINLTVSGGTNNGFTYVWNTGATTKDITNLGVANYSVTITDIGSGCVVTRSYTITQPATAVSISVTKTNATGCNSLGTITATGNGGTTGYQYSINGINYFPSGLFTGLYAGSYTVWVMDSKGCTKSAVVAITDNGSDEYESNNSKGQAKQISSPINARIALATDVTDWFKFTTTVAGSYVLGMSHPTVNYTFNLYAAGNNTPVLVPASVTATTKMYTLTANTTYYISITGGLSYTCYTLSVSSPATAPLITKAAEKEDAETISIDRLTAMVYPNPHRGNFNIKIASPENGIAKVELFTVGGQKLATKIVSVQKGDNNNVPFNNIRQGTVFYRVQIGKHTANGKVVGIE